jgi:GntR family transcriptional regulator, transcriptional repressor for pyruvate dehydrogenase complex
MESAYHEAMVSQMAAVAFELSNPRVSRAEQIARAIETEIRDQALQTGFRVGTKEELRARFRVALATVSEAVKLLEAQGIAEARPGPGGGVFVAGDAARVFRRMAVLGFDGSDVTGAESAEVRDALEPLIYRHAARYRRAADIRGLRQIIARMATHVADPAAYAKDTAEFHQRVVALSPNSSLRSVYLTLSDWCDYTSRGQDAPPLEVNPESIEVHRKLLDAIAAGDDTGLDEVVEAHRAHRARHGLWEARPAERAAKQAR